MTEKPASEVAIAILDALYELAEGGDCDRDTLLKAAIRREVFANVAIHRWMQDHPGHGPLTDGERYNAIDDGLTVIGEEALNQMLKAGYLSADNDHIRLGDKQYKIDRKPYIPGTHREEDLFHSLRRVSPARKALIEDSIASLGDLREFFPVLVDEDDNVVDGRHRRAIDPLWPASYSRVPRDKRLAAGLAANRSNAWSKEDWTRLRTHVQFIHGAKATSRKLAELALAEDPYRSDREIARLTGASHTTVAQARKTGQFGQFSKAAGGRPKGVKDHTGTPRRQYNRTRTPEQEAALDEEIERRLRENEPTQREELAPRFGFSPRQVQDRIAIAKDRLSKEIKPQPHPQHTAAPSTHVHIWDRCACGAVR